MISHLVSNIANFNFYKFFIFLSLGIFILSLIANIRLKKLKESKEEINKQGLISSFIVNVIMITLLSLVLTIYL